LGYYGFKMVSQQPPQGYGPQGYTPPPGYGAPPGYPRAQQAPPKKKPPTALLVVAGVVGFIVLAGAIKAMRVRAGADTAAQSSVATTASAAPSRPALPPEPPAPAASLAREVPDLEAKLAADTAYQAVWTGPRAHLNTLLTATSEFLAKDRAAKVVFERLKENKLNDAVVKLYMIQVRAGRYPEDFTKKLGAHLEAVKREPRMGTWSRWKEGDVPHDFTALAAWAKPDDPAYLRELIAARREGAGPFRWEVPLDPPLRPWLVSHRHAAARLALLGDVTAADCAPVSQLVVALDARTGQTREVCAPKHSVVEDVDLAPKPGRRITVASPDWEMSDDECAAIIGEYRARAGEEGLVRVTVPLQNDQPENHPGVPRDQWVTDGVLCFDNTDDKEGVKVGPARTLQENLNRKAKAARTKASPN
jgi:hypothetical protein